MSSIPQEGVIKFKFNLKMASAIAESMFLKLEKWRAILYRMSFIGEYKSEGVGYGNLSCRITSGKDEFIITGTQTGKFPHLDGTQYTRVTKCDLNKMTVDAIGPIAPSSESLTHYAIYKSAPHINIIFHVHHKELWNYMLQNNYDRTPESINYGTNEMAESAKKLIGTKIKGIFVMAGHQDGIMAYGQNVEEVGQIILQILKESRK